MVSVQPGQHILQVTKEGYEPFTDKVPVGAGETFRESAPLVKLLPASTSGTLVMQGNLTGFKVIADGTPRGVFMKKEGTLTLEQGLRTIRYSNEDGTDIVEHKVQIAAGKSISDIFALKPPSPPKLGTTPPPPPPPAAGNLVVETTPNAQVTIDGLTKGPADSSGKLAVNSLSPGTHAIEITLDKYQSVTGRAVTVASGQTTRFAQPLTANAPPAPTSGSLSIETTALAQISIDGQRKGVADGSGQLYVDNLPPGIYKLEIGLENFLPRQQPITIRAGSNSVSARLDPKPVERTSSNVEASVDHTADDRLGIQQALRSFEQAYTSRNMDRIKATWINVGPRLKNLEGVLPYADMVSIKENCEGQPAINGDTATQNCIEVSQLLKSDGPKRSAKIITFVKTGGKWVMKDKVP